MDQANLIWGLLGAAVVAAGAGLWWRAQQQRQARQQAQQLAEQHLLKLAQDEAAAALEARLASENAARSAAETIARERAEQAAADARAQAEAQAQATAQAEAEAEAVLRAAREAADAAARQAAEAERLAAERAAAQTAERAAAAREAADREAAEREAALRAEQEREVALRAAALAALVRQQALASAPPPAPRRPQDTLVMVADDSKVVRVKTSRLLAQHGYRVVLAEDGARAAELLETEVPAVLITDVEMPGLDGLQLTRHVRAHARASGIPIIMITSADDRLKDAAAEAGVTLVLGKPYPEDELIACIERSQQVPAGH